MRDQIWFENSSSSQLRSMRWKCRQLNVNRNRRDRGRVRVSVTSLRENSQPFFVLQKTRTRCWRPRSGPCSEGWWDATMRSWSRRENFTSWGWVLSSEQSLEPLVLTGQARPGSFIKDHWVGGLEPLGNIKHIIICLLALLALLALPDCVHIITLSWIYFLILARFLAL